MAVTRGALAGRWVLSSEEIRASVRAPLEVRRVSVDHGPRTSAFGGVLDSAESVAPRTAAPKTVAVAAEWRADGVLDDLRAVEEQLHRLAARDERLGRPPLVTLRWGHVQVIGYLSGLRISWVDGVFPVHPHLPRAMIVSLSVAAARPRELQQSARFQSETTTVRVGAGATFEGLAWEHYHDPTLGSILARHNPQVPLDGPQDGDLVRVFDPDHAVLSEDPGPVSPALGGGVDRLLEAIARARMGRGVVTLDAAEEALR